MNRTHPVYIVKGGPKGDYVTPHLEDAMRKYMRLMRNVGNYSIVMTLTIAEVSVCTTVGSPEHLKILEKMKKR